MPGSDWNGGEEKGNRGKRKWIAGEGTRIKTKRKKKRTEKQKTTMEAKRVAAQLQLMAKQLDCLAGHVLSEVKKWRMNNFRHSSFISDIQVKINVLQNYLSWFNYSSV